MNRTWSQAVAKVRGNFQLLALIAGIFMLLPSLLIVVTMPALFGAALPGGNPEAARAQLNAISPAFYGVFVVIMLASLVGYSAMISLMGQDRPTVGGAIGKGFKALPTLVGAFLLFLVGYLLAAVVIGLGVGLLAVAAASVSGGAAGLVAVLAGIALFIGVLYVLTRFSLLLPVIVLDGVLNPITAYVRSWRLTKPSAWRIFGFFALLFVVYIVIAVLLVMVGSAVGMAGGRTGGSGIFVFGVLSGLLGMAVAMVVSGILVAMHDQLAGTNSRAVIDTFE
ncbi:MAG: hypothetical protein ABIO26_06830 [Croceibacterium sp.]